LLCETLKVNVVVVNQHSPDNLPKGQMQVTGFLHRDSDDRVEAALAACGLIRRDSAVLVLDLVGSVRRIAADEPRSVAQWVDFAQQLTSHVLPAHDGRVVKSRGDGLMVEFADVQSAVAAAFGVQQLAETFLDPEPIRLHMGLDCGSILVGGTDVYGHKVNVAAVLADSAPPNVIVVSQGVKDRLTDGVEAGLEEMEPLKLKGTHQSVRRYTMTLGSSASSMTGASSGFDIRPTLAIVPLQELDSGTGASGLGDIICEDLLRHLAPLGIAHVISRRSSAAFRNRADHPAFIASRLSAGFVVTGFCQREGSHASLRLLLHDAGHGEMIWEKSWRLPLHQLLSGSASGFRDIAAALIGQIMEVSAARAIACAPGLPTLESHTLLLGAMALMNRQQREDFFLARGMLDELIRRSPRHPLPFAWLAQWLNLSIQQGWSANPAADGQSALDACHTALDIDPESALAMSVLGLILTTVRRQVDQAQSLFETALHCNPNEPLAWLFHSVNRMFSGDGQMAMVAARRAIFLTPFDPSLYLFQAVEASAAFVTGNDALAAQLSLRAIRSNRQHVSSHRVRTAALWRLGEGAEARRSAFALLGLEPDLTVDSWRRRTPASSAVAERFAEALKGAGVPEH
jgi:adenylate cyclase